jgi:Uncharacterized conserved protein
MSLETAQQYLAERGHGDDVMVTPPSVATATVEAAAAALGVEPARIAKTMSFRGAEPDTAILVVLAGDARVHNGSFKRTFGVKAHMLRGDEVEHLTGHRPGGVCPFANPPSARVYLDTSLQRFETVYPACGDDHSVIELSCAELARVTGGPQWVTVSTVGAPVPVA